MRERLLEFIGRLREAGVRISVAETLDAANGVAAAGFERIRMREALAATLIKDEADRPIFDREFDLYFRSRRPIATSAKRGQSWQGMAGRHGRISDSAGARALQKPDPRAAAANRLKPTDQTKSKPKKDGAQHEANAEGRLDAGTDKDLPRGSAAARIARQREAQEKPFSAYNDLDYERALECLEHLRRRFRVRVGRRLRFARKGRIDFRRTIRASIQRGGALIDLRMRRRRPRHLDLLVLADISGSVRYASSLMLGLVSGAREFFRTVHSFVYIDRLAEAGFENGHLVMYPALDLYARSDFGRVLSELLGTRRYLLGRATLVVVLGDGRNNRRPARTDLLRQIGRLSRAVIWLNPEEQQRWGTGDSAIELYARVVDALMLCENLRALQASLSKLA